MNIVFSKINFGATPLFDVKLKKRINNSYQTVDARISELNPHDEADQKIMEELSEKWNVDDNPFSIMGVIRQNFQNISQAKNKLAELKYYVTEIANKGEKTSSENITSVIEMTNPAFNSDMIYVNSLQTNPSIVKEYIPSVKGAGELAMYAAAKIAKIFSADFIQADSCADGFYQNIGMKQHDDDSIFVLEKQDYDYFLKRIEDKYSFKSV